MRERDSSGASRDLHQGAFTDLLLAYDDNLLVPLQAGVDFDFITNRRADLDPAPVDPLTVRGVDIHGWRALCIGHHGLSRDGQRAELRRPEDPGFCNHTDRKSTRLNSSHLGI